MFNSIIKKCSWCNVDAGLLVLRIGVAGIFIMTGWMKVSDLPGTVGFFASMGFGAFWAYLVTAVELLGGVAVLLGIYTRVAAKLLAIIMVVAIVVLIRAHNVTLVIGPVALLASNLALVLAGSGRYACMRSRLTK